MLEIIKFFRALENKRWISLSVFFIIIATLYSQNDIETDNPIIISGAAVIDTLSKDGFFENLNEKFEGIKQDLSDSFS